MPDGQDSAITRDRDELLSRLQKARKRRRDYIGGHPTLRYCLLCDESVLAVRTTEGEYERLDCRHDHFEYILEEAHDHAQISAWIDCIRFMEGEYAE